PLLTGAADRIRDEIFAETNFHSSYDPMRCVRTERYKLIRDFGTTGRMVHLGGDKGISELLAREHGAMEEPRSPEMLFDLYLDPMERVNVAGEARYRGVYEELSGRLTAWMERTRDPL